jgi:hypothetical protein
MSYETNVYYSPEASGLVQLGVMDEEGLSYEYNTFVAWQHLASGRVFYAWNSGCSCPTPFEDFFFRGPDDTNLEELTAHNSAGFESAVDSWNAGYSGARVPRNERDAFVDAALLAVRGKRA